MNYIFALFCFGVAIFEVTLKETKKIERERERETPNTFMLKHYSSFCFFTHFSFKTKLMRMGRE